MLTGLAGILEIPRTALGLAPEPEPNQGRTLDGVNRREALGGGVALAVTILLRHGVATAGRITAADVTQCWAALQRLEDALRHGSYPDSVSQELQRVPAVTMEQAGWSAFDAGYAQQARHWWLETCHLAEVIDIPEARIVALTSMALQAGQRPGGGPETAELAQAAAAVARHEAPRSCCPCWPRGKPSATPRPVTTRPPSPLSPGPGTGSTAASRQRNPSGWLSTARQISPGTRP